MDRQSLVAGLAALVSVNLFTACGHDSHSLSAGRGMAAACASIEVFAVLPEGARGGRQLPAMDGARVRVFDAPLVTTQDILVARPGTAEGSPDLEIDLLPAPAARVRAFTTEHVGDKLAFVVNHQVRSVVRVLDPIHGDGFMIEPFPSVEADALIRSLSDPQRNCPGP